MTEALSSRERLELVSQFVFREQSFFWQRFAAFAAMHAGLFVLAASGVVQSATVASSVSLDVVVNAAGLALALLWLFVQYASLHYVDRFKGEFHDLLKEFDLSPKQDWLFSNLRPSSTDAGAFVVWIVGALWAFLVWG